jgi:hypothetical protein
LGVPVDLERLLDVDDPVYRVFLLAVIDRTNRILEEAHRG